MPHYCACLSIAGSDPSGGAGIQADLKTFGALGCYGAAALTALTVQNSRGVRRCSPVNAGLVYEQAAAVMEDLHPEAVKIGMLGTAANVRAVSRLLRTFPTPFVVLDPVLLSTSGHPLLSRTATRLLLTELVPLCTLLTPNLPELEVLSGTSHIVEGARRIISRTGCPNILVKGGHSHGKPTDTLVTASAVQTFTSRRIHSANTHGTGCTLSSAIAAYAARGLAPGEAVGAAKKYVTDALKSGASVQCGEGSGAPNHFFKPQRAVIKEI